MADALVVFLKALREDHDKTPVEVAVCMSYAYDYYRRLESGRRNLPDYRHGLVQWVRRFLRCVEATPEEEQHGLELMAREFTVQFAEWQSELEQRMNEPNQSGKDTRKRGRQ